MSCKTREAERDSKPDPAPAPIVAAPQSTPIPPSSATQLLIDQASSCALGQRGLVLDLADPVSEARRNFSLTTSAPPEITVREGVSFRRLDQMNTDFVFWLTEPLTNFDLSARVFGLGSERIAAYVDGQRIGAAKLSPQTSTTVRIGARDRIVEPGRHTLTLSLSKPRRGTPDADVSWVRLGARPEKDESPSDFPATRREIFTEVTLGEERLRSVVLRPSGSLRCSVWVPEGAHFSAKTGIWGEGAGEVEVVVHTAKGERFVVASQVREEDDPRDFRPIEADLSRFSSTFIDLEFSAPRSLKRARVAIGEPRLTSKQSQSTVTPPARRAIVVVLSGLGNRHAPPAAAANGLPVVNALAQQGVYFQGYRATSTSVPAIMASLVTGLSPAVHGVAGVDKGLSREPVTLASVVEGNGGTTALFTSVPLSFAPFGFERGFSTYETYPPQADVAATAPIVETKKWLKKHLVHQGPVLTLLHLRGGHPPFDVSREGSAELAPAEYGGNLTGRRAAIQLAEIRARRSERSRTMPDEDWTRLLALQKRALLDQSTHLTELFEWLRQQGAYDDTLIVLMGDVGAGEVPKIPFDPDAALDESYLGVPLVVKFPRGYASGQHVPGHFAPRDVTVTLARSLGVEWLQTPDGIDLGRSDATRLSAVRPHIAFRANDYSMRLGDMILTGTDGRAPSLCLPALDPTCEVDRTKERILESRALWFTLYRSLLEPLGKDPGAPTIEGDEAFRSSLVVWGLTL